MNAPAFSPTATAAGRRALVQPPQKPISSEPVRNTTFEPSGPRSGAHASRGNPRSCRTFPSRPTRARPRGTFAVVPLDALAEGTGGGGTLTDVPEPATRAPPAIAVVRMAAAASSVRPRLGSDQREPAVTCGIATTLDRSSVGAVRSGGISARY